MIPATHQLTAALKRTEHRLLQEQRANDLKSIHARGAEVLPAEYLISHQPGDPNAVHKYRALRKAKRARKAAKNAAKTH